jgi:hypothetical protein
LFSRHLDGSHEQVEEYVGGVCAELPVFVLGHLNAADILSRSPGAESYENDYESTEQFVCYVAQNAVPKAMTIAEIQEASEKDKTICKFRECIEKNKWTKEGEAAEDLTPISEF